MIVMKRNGLLVRWAYFLETPPSRTSLCAIFWRSMLVTPILKPLVCGVAGLLVAALIVQLRMDPWPVLMPVFTLLGLAAFLAAIVLFVVTAEWITQRLKGDIDDLPLLLRGAIAVKQRVCPIVEIER